MNHEQTDDFIRNLRTRLLNERHVVVERRHFSKNPGQSYDKIEIELYKNTPTHIPYVVIVWENGDTSRLPWNDITDVRHDGVKSIYKYCPIRLNTIEPANSQLAHRVLAMHHQVSTIEE